MSLSGGGLPRFDHEVAHDGADHALADGIAETIAVTARMVAASPTLRARQEEILAGHARALAETGGDAADPGLQAAWQRLARLRAPSRGSRRTD
jgi:hypothetical protein